MSPDVANLQPAAPATALETAAGEPVDPGQWIDRSVEADRVLRFLAKARGRLVVLYGRRGIGKTELVRKWVLKQLGQPPGFYLDLHPALPGRPGSAAHLDRLWSAMKDGAIA